MKVAVVGGGASGMFAAIFAAQNGASVTLYEKNDKLGKKIYITGKGRCNVTNLCSTDEFLNNVVSNPKFLFSAANKWDSKKTVQFFEENKLQLKVERGNRVFPVSDKASDVTKVLQAKLVQNGVEIRLNSAVKAVSMAENGFFVSTISDIVLYDRVIIACGGMSYPTTGSSGDGFKLAEKLGHSISQLRPSLCDIQTIESVKCLQGLSLKNVTLRAKLPNGKKSKTLFFDMGEMLFTDSGLSGPLALSCSSFVNRLDEKQLRDLQLVLDLKPGLNLNEKPSLDERLERDFSEFCSKEFKNSLSKLLPQRMADYIVETSGISPTKKVSQITPLERQNLAYLIKNLTFSVKGLGGFDRAIVTSGGVNISQVSPSTLESKLHKGLYFCGEVLDVDALTGGFNLQIAFSTGFLAGTSSATKEEKNDSN